MGTQPEEAHVSNLASIVIWLAIQTASFYPRACIKDAWEVSGMSTVCSMFQGFVHCLDMAVVNAAAVADVELSCTISQLAYVFTILRAWCGVTIMHTG